MDPAARLLPHSIQPHLATRTFARRIYYYPETGSTNDVALELARAGEPEGTVVVTDFQRHGRGRREHSWSSREGHDLLFSLILRPAGAPESVLPVTLALSLGVAVALQANMGAPVGVKWPNDLVVGVGKIGGILAEATHRQGSVEYVVVGFGINVNSTADDFPDDLRGRVASCRMLAGAPVDRARLLADVAGALEAYYRRFQVDGFGVLAGAYNERMSLVGRSIHVRGSDWEAEAQVIGVRPDGRLGVRLNDGRTVDLHNEIIEVVR